MKPNLSIFYLLVYSYHKVIFLIESFRFNYWKELINFKPFGILSIVS